MNRVRTSLIVGVVMTAAAGLASAGDTKAKAQELGDQAKAAVTPGEVVLTGSDTKTLRDSKDISSYQVCVKADKEAGSVMVMSGATSKTLAPGECGVVSGSRITAMPSKPLTGATHSTVTIHERD
jgi:hypothetical protein